LVLAHFTKEVEFLELRGVWVPSVDSALFEKMKYIFFYCAGEKFGEVTGNTHRTLVLAAPDAGPERPVWCQECRAHRTLAPDAGRLLFERPVVCDVSECARGVSDR